MNNYIYKIFGMARYPNEGKEYLDVMIADVRTNKTSLSTMTLTPISNKTDVILFVSGIMNCDTDNIFVMPHINFEKVGIRL